jgi:PAS domain S-box-containing protein
MKQVSILVVEDEMVVSKDLAIKLTKAGYRVAGTVATGRAAVQAAEESLPDLVLMDIVLQGHMDGIEAARAIGQRFGIPVVYLTAYADEDILERARLTAPFGYLVKPYAERELRTTIEMALYKHGLEQRLKQSEERFRSLFEDAPLAYCSVDRDGMITEANRECLRLFGMSREEVASACLFDFIHPTDRERFRLTFEQLKYTWRFAGEFHVQTHAKEIPIVSCHGTGASDAEGHFKEAHFICKDVTEKRRAEETIRCQNEFLNSVIESLTHPFYVINPDTFQVELSNSAAVLHGFTVGATCFRALYGRSEPCARHGINCPVEQVRKTGTHATAEHVHRSVDGTSIPVEVHAYPIFDARRQLAGIIAHCVDISDRKRSEELMIQAARLQVAGELASGVAHNFNNLLQVVVGGTQLALMDAEMGELGSLKSHLKSILDNSSFGTETVRRLQSFANIRSSLHPEQQEPVDLSRLARQAVDLSRQWWQVNAEARGAHIDVELELQPDCWVTGGQNEYFEVLSSLIKNAAEALPNGGRLTVKTEWSGDRVILTVRDTGVGIPAKHLPRVFDPFWGTKGLRGAGMGLAVSRAILTRNNGSITVESKPEEGSVFRVVLPAIPAPARPVRQLRTASFDLRLTILIVDDMQPVATMLAETLNKFGQRTFTAIGGEEALAIVEREPIELIICDLGMPGMSGWEFGQSLQELCRSLGKPKIPLIMMTGIGAAASQADPRTGTAGVDAFIEKPVEIKRLLALIRDLCGGG